MSTSTHRRFVARKSLLLIALLAVAVVARVWGLYYGLPWLFHQHDETQVVLRGLRFGTGDLNPHYFAWPGILMFYVSFLCDVWLFAIGRVAGLWSGKPGFAAAYFSDPTWFYVLPRLVTVALGTATVWITERLGRRTLGVAAGLAAGWLVAVNALSANWSHFSHPVTAMVTFNTLALWAAVRLARHGRPRHLFFGAVALALGVAAQYHAAVVAVPLALAWLWRAIDAPGERGRWLLRALGAVALAIGVFLVLSPYTLLDFATFRRDLEWISSTTAAENLGYTTSLRSGLGHYLRSCLLPTVGLPIALLGLLGAAIAVVRRNRPGILLAVFSLVYTIVASRAGQLTDRYALPLVPPLALLAVMALQAAARRAFGDRPRATRLVLLATLLCSVPSLLGLVENDFLMTRPDTRILSKRWFEAHVPENERVVLDMARFWNSTSPPLVENAARLRERIEEVQRGDMGGGHDASYAEYYRYRLENPRHPAYYILGTNMGADARPLAEYRARGFHWAITSDLAEETQRAIAVHGDSTGVRYYAALEREATLAAEFAPKRWERLGPRIRIWRLDRSP